METMEQEEAEQQQQHAAANQRQEFRKHYLKRRHSVKAATGHHLHSSPLNNHLHHNHDNTHLNSSPSTTTSSLHVNTSSPVPIVQSFLDIASNIHQAATMSYVYSDSPQTPVKDGSVALEIPPSEDEKPSTEEQVDEKIKYSEANLKKKLKDWFVSNASHDVKHEGMCTEKKVSLLSSEVLT